MSLFPKNNVNKKQNKKIETKNNTLSKVQLPRVFQIAAKSTIAGLMSIGVLTSCICDKGSTKHCGEKSVSEQWEDYRREETYVELLKARTSEACKYVTGKEECNAEDVSSADQERSEELYSGYLLNEAAKEMFRDKASQYIPLTTKDWEEIMRRVEKEYELLEEFLIQDIYQGRVPMQEIMYEGHLSGAVLKKFPYLERYGQAIVEQVISRLWEMEGETKVKRLDEVYNPDVINDLKNGSLKNYCVDMYRFQLPEGDILFTRIKRELEEQGVGKLEAPDF